MFSKGGRQDDFRLSTDVKKNSMEWHKTPAKRKWSSFNPDGGMKKAQEFDAIVS